MKHFFPRVSRWKLLVQILLSGLAVIAFCSYPRDLNLARVKSGTIKNDSGEAARLLWWMPTEGVEVMQAPQKGDNAEGCIMPQDWWMDGRCFKVAELGDGPQGTVKIYLRCEGRKVEPCHDGLTYFARRKDLNQTISVNRVISQWFDDNTGAGQ